MKELNSHLVELALKPIIEYNIYNDTLVITMEEFLNSNINLHKMN